jgi:hypothetical protein
MASIFFTERLPGISKLQNVDSFDVARGAVVVDPSGSEKLTIAANYDDPEPAFDRLPCRLPQKQGLCQVVNGPDFGMLSDF